MKTIKQLFSCASFFFAFALSAQTYLPGNAYDPMNVVAFRKVHFAQAGEKFSYATVNYDTTAHLQHLTVYLLNPDYTVFRTMATDVPDSAFINTHEGGVKIVENLENGKPVYYFLFNSLINSEDYVSGNRATMVREDGVKTGSGACSWMGFKIANIHGLHKLVADRQAIDTIHYTNQNGNGSYTHQFGTTSVYDIQTGALEHTFPRGTTVSSVESIGGSMKYFTTNDYLNRWLQPYDPWGKVSDPMAVTHYNSDFSPWLSSNGIPSQLAVEGKYISNANLYYPLVAGDSLYFIHHVEYRDETDPFYFVTRTCLTDRNGGILKWFNGQIFNPWHFGDDDDVCVRYLPGQGKYVLIDHQTVYSIPALDTLGTIAAYAMDRAGGIRFIQQGVQQMTILNEDFTPYKTIQNPDTTSNFVGANFHSFVSDDKLELVFRGDSSLVVVNEDGKTILNKSVFYPISQAMFSNKPLVMNVEGEKYGRISDVTGIQYHRTMPAFIQALKNDTVERVSIQGRRLDGSNIFTGEPLSGILNHNLGEGTYHFRALFGPNSMSTYYPSVLMWEEAPPVVFHADDSLNLNIRLLDLPAALNPTDAGSVSGTISRQVVLQNSAPVRTPAEVQKTGRLTEVYLLNTTTGKVVAQNLEIESNFSFSNIPWGTYQVLVNVPGMKMGSIHTVVLSGAKPSVVTDYENVGDTLIQALNPQAVKSTRTSEGLYPNPAFDFVWITGIPSGSTVALFDLAGKKVGEKTLVGNALSVSDLKQGNYLVRYNRDGKQVTERLMKK